MSEVTLGQPYRDTFTGFEGHAIARTVYADGHVMVCLSGPNPPQAPVETWLPEGQLERAKGASSAGFVPREAP